MESELPVVEGVVDRISGSGNAILETSSGGELNLGPLNAKVVGEKIRAVELSGPWAFCLNETYVTEEYLEEMRSQSGSSISFDDLQPLVDGSSKHEDTGQSSAEHEDIGRTVRLEINSLGKSAQYDDGKPIRVRRQRISEYTDPSGKIPVEIIAIRNGVAIGVPALELIDSEELETGDVVNMVIQQTTGEHTTIGFSDESGYPIHSTDLVATPGTVARVGVVNVFNSHIDASPKALPPEAWPEEGAVVYVTIDRITNGGDGYGFTDGLRVRLPDALKVHSALEHFKARITDQKDGILNVAVDELRSNERPVTGEVVQAEVAHRGEDETLCKAEDVPIRIPGPIPAPIKTVKCKISGSRVSHLVGSVAACPEVQKLKNSGKFRVSIEGQDGGHGVGTLEGIPVVIPGGQDLVGEEVHLGIIEVRTGYLLAGVDSYSTAPDVGKEIIVSEEAYRSRDGRLCFVDSVPIVLPEGSNWPIGDIRLGVEGTKPAKIRANVVSLPADSRPDLGDEVEISASELEPGDDVTLINGIPIEIPPHLGQLSGTVRVSISGVQSDCLRSSIQNLSDNSVPGVGKLVSMDIDSVSKKESRGRISEIPTLLLKTNVTEVTKTEVLVAGQEEDFLIAVDIETDRYDVEIDSETLINHYRALIKAREAWREGKFKLAIQCCQDAADLIETKSNTADIFRLDTMRQETFILGEHFRTDRGAREAQHEVEEKIKSLSLPDVPAASWMVKELKAYRLALSGVTQDNCITSGRLYETTRTMREAKNIESNPWQTIMPHPLFATLLASVEKPQSTSAKRADQLVNQAPEYWPFLTLSDVQ